MTRSRGLLGGAVIVYFVIALEVLIMISPFAAFFYAAFNPVLLFLARWPATNWLAAFFLPHMVLPPGPILQGVRVAGSVFFVCGSIVFLVCAGQVYSHKLLRRGPALGGLYRWIRHPQYVALAVTGFGLAILWPRFLTIVLWAVMVGLYWLLARDEERRMVAEFGDRYRDYMARTGAFVPRSWERAAARIPLPWSPGLRGAFGIVFLGSVVVGGAFALRAYTVARLPLWSEGRITAIPILPDDGILLEHRMAEVLKLPALDQRVAAIPGPVLVYMVPTEYVMQGMIADTGPRWRLYEHHRTLAMIADWIFHPFRHLKGGHPMMHHGAMTGSATGAAPGSVVRRLIFLRIDSNQVPASRSTLFGIDTGRTPQFFADVDLHHLAVLSLRPLPPGTGWGRVPTPMF